LGQCRQMCWLSGEQWRLRRVVVHRREMCWLSEEQWRLRYRESGGSPQKREGGSVENSGDSGIEREWGFTGERWWLSGEQWRLRYRERGGFTLEYSFRGDRTLYII
jgi:hypothetical protein